MLASGDEAVAMHFEIWKYYHSTGKTHFKVLQNLKVLCDMQEETQEYAEEAKLRELVSRYSEFIEFPIYLYSSKEVEMEAAEEETDEAVADEDVSDAEDVADEAGMVATCC